LENIPSFPGPVLPAVDSFTNKSRALFHHNEPRGFFLASGNESRLSKCHLKKKDSQKFFRGFLKAPSEFTVDVKSFCTLCSSKDNKEFKESKNPERKKERKEKRVSASTEE